MRLRGAEGGGAVGELFFPPPRGKGDIALVLPVWTGMYTPNVFLFLVLVSACGIHFNDGTGGLVIVPLSYSQV